MAERGIMEKSINFKKIADNVVWVYFTFNDGTSFYMLFYYVFLPSPENTKIARLAFKKDLFLYLNLSEKDKQEILKILGCPIDITDN